jgi:hypothetical protein
LGGMKSEIFFCFLRVKFQGQVYRQQKIWNWKTDRIWNLENNAERNLKSKSDFKQQHRILLGRMQSGRRTLLGRSKNKTTDFTRTRKNHRAQRKNGIQHGV